VRWWPWRAVARGVAHAALFSSDVEHAVFLARSIALYNLCAYICKLDYVALSEGCVLRLSVRLFLPLPRASARASVGCTGVRHQHRLEEGQK
jgi:hypothetical protein